MLLLPDVLIHSLELNPLLNQPRMNNDHSVTIKYKYIGCVMKVAFINHVLDLKQYTVLYYFKPTKIDVLGLTHPFIYLYRPS